MNSFQRTDRLTALFTEMRGILETKGGDYADSDVLSNFKYAGRICGLSPEVQCLSLIATKVARLGVLLESRSPKNESIADSVIDLITYGFLLKCLLEDTKDDK